MKVGIAIDDYKVAHYRLFLDEQKFCYEVFPGLTEKTIFIKVDVKPHNLAQMAIDIKKLEKDKPWKK